MKHAVDQARKFNLPITIIFSYRLTDYEKEDDVRNHKLAVEANARQRFACLERKILLGEEVDYEFFVEVGFLADRIESHTLKNSNTILVISHSLAVSLKELSVHFFKSLNIKVEYVPALLQPR